jgi:hypothetical protein
MMVGCAQNELRLVDAATGAPIRALVLGEDEWFDSTGPPVLSAAGDMVAAVVGGGKDDPTIPPTGQHADAYTAAVSVRVWDVATGNVIHATPRRRTSAWGDAAYSERLRAAFTPDGGMLVEAVTNRNALTFWSLDDKTVVATLFFRGCEDTDSAIVVAPDGRVDFTNAKDCVRDYVRCAIGDHALPAAACFERLIVPGLWTTLAH